MVTVIPHELRHDALRAAILRALEQAYAVNLERHDPSVGDTALTFGIHTWQSGNHYLLLELASIAGVNWTIQNHSLELRVGRCRLRTHKLGHSEADDPWQSFPEHAGPAARMAGRYEQLEFPYELPGIEPLDWVIGHYGNFEDGLRAVRLQAVGTERSDDGRIIRWSAVEPLWVAAAVVPAPLPAVLADTPIAVPIEEPDISLRDESLEGAEGAPS